MRGVAARCGLLLFEVVVLKDVRGGAHQPESHGDVAVVTCRKVISRQHNHIMRLAVIARVDHFVDARLRHWIARLIPLAVAAPDGAMTRSMRRAFQRRPSDPAHSAPRRCKPNQRARRCSSHCATTPEADSRVPKRNSVTPRLPSSFCGLRLASQRPRYEIK